MSALPDIRVMDLSTGVAGPFCAKLFADFGADVIKTEPPEGDPSRSFGPFRDDHPNPDASGMFHYLNANKRGVTLDIESERGRGLLAELCADADVVVETYAPGFMDSIGLGYDDLEAFSPGVVLISITPFGQTGPWRRLQATDLTLYAASGLSYVNGSPRREPLKEPGPESCFQAGASAFIGGMVRACESGHDRRRPARGRIHTGIRRVHVRAPILGRDALRAASPARLDPASALQGRLRIPERQARCDLGVYVAVL